MANILQKAAAILIGTSGKGSKRPFKKLTERQLIQLESEIGREVFGPVPDGHRREFFCLDATTWIWYEEWTNEHKQTKALTTRYEVHPNGILKAQDGTNYKFIEGEELQNLAIAARMYYELTMRKIYKKDPATGLPLTQAPATIHGA